MPVRVTHKTTVVNQRTHVPTHRDVCIMRGTPFGNPFSHLPYPNTVRVKDRRAAIRDYLRWIMGRLHVPHRRPPTLDRIRSELTGKVLVCCCKPLECHGDILSALTRLDPLVVLEQIEKARKAEHLHALTKRL